MLVIIELVVLIEVAVVSTIVVVHVVVVHVVVVKSKTGRRHLWVFFVILSQTILYIVQGLADKLESW
ncbi:hypothetical protein C8F01DRAFT_1181128 [Mycena amicta]|nr:hypothetical protein C8F01DRAFT_1181128 [Mycena amicta]